MAFPTQGKNAVLLIATNDISTYCTSITVSRKNDVRDVTTFGNTAHVYGGTLADGTMTVQGLWDKTATVGSETVFSALIGVGTETAFEWGPEGNTSGQVKYSGNFILDSYEVSEPVAEEISFTATLQISGAVTVGTYSA